MIKDSIHHEISCDDFDRMADLLDAFGNEVGPAISRHDRSYALANILAAYDAGALLIVWDDQWRACILSFIHKAFLVDELHAAEIAFVVDPQCRSQGIGPRVLLQYEQCLQKLGVRRSCIASSHPAYHEEAGRLYERLGYSRASIGYQKDM